MGKQYHEPYEFLSDSAKDIARAMNSLEEELIAVDRYNQREDMEAIDSELKSILEHNRKEEVEHAAMIIEWLRRNMDGWEDELKTYLFTNKPVTSLEENSDSKNENEKAISGTSLNIGSIK
jgi:ferritin-like protein